MKNKILTALFFVLTAFSSLRGFAAQSLLFTTNNFSVGSSSASNPTAIAAGDLNGDGRVDLITANQSDTTLTVLTNAGYGKFVFKSTLNVGGSPQFVLATDVNGDGKIDLVGVNAGSFGNGYQGSLSVLTNSGGGNFQTEATLDVGSLAYGAAAADFNNDGKIDLACVNNNDGTISVLTNQDNKSFVLKTTLNVGSGVNSYPLFILASDVNGDGKPDLVCVNQGDGTLSVLTNNGTGDFILMAEPSVGSGSGSNPYCVAADDVNGDGKMDLISADQADGTLTVLTNNGSGGFGFYTTLNSGVDALSQPYYVIAADLNGDGKPDLVSANNADNTLTVFTNNGHGFGLSNTLGVGANPAAIVAATLNADSQLDLACVNYGEGSVSVLLQRVSPQLNIHPSGSQYLLTWNSAFTNFVVQTNASLTSPNWLTTSYPVSASSETNLSSTVATPPSGNVFFRLFWP